MTATDPQTWTDTAGAVPAEVRREVSRVVAAHRREIADEFYARMLASPEAAVFLDHDVVHDRLHASLQRWLTELFAEETVRSPEAAIAHQKQIGEVHARTRVPIHLVLQGMRVVRRRIAEGLPSALGAPDVAAAIRYVDEMLDLAMECMGVAFARSLERGVRTDEAYRLHTATQNVAAERERQRAALLEWCQEVLFGLQVQEHPAALRPLGGSEFGLWLAHKGIVMLGGSPEMASITTSIERVDTILLPRLATADPAVRRDLVVELQREVEGLLFLLSGLFDHQEELENGRDHLTRLLNRRFLPAVLLQEVALHRSRSQIMAVLLIDVDHFKRINDGHGHDAGDLALQQVATIVADQVRAGDFVFRYGGDELLVVLVETTAEAACRIAEAIRARVEHAELSLGAGHSARTTLSIGIAMFDGHPDPDRMITRADTALLEAKAAGRNTWRVADDHRPARVPV